MGPIFLKSTVGMEFTGRPSIKELRSVLTLIAKRVDPGAYVTVKETPFPDRANVVKSTAVEAAWGEWS